MESINERIRRIIDLCYRGNASAFCRSTGLSLATINQIVHGRMSTPSFETLERIFSKVSPPLNLEWFFIGTGEMLKPEGSELPSEADGRPSEAEVARILQKQEIMIELKEEEVRRLSLKLEELYKEVGKLQFRLAGNGGSTQE